MHSDLGVLEEKAQTLFADGKYSELAQLCTQAMAMVAVKPNWVSTINRGTVELHFIITAHLHASSLVSSSSRYTFFEVFATISCSRCPLLTQETCFGISSSLS
jgi:hypothetical protein